MADNKVIISDSYYFTADDNQYILYEYGKREKIDIKVLNKEIEEIVAREQVLRDEIAKIIAEIEVV